MPRLVALGETSELLDNAIAVLSRHAERSGGAFYYYIGGVKKVLVVTRRDVLRHVLKDNFENYPKSDIQVRRMGEFLGHGLLTDHGAPWRRRRHAMQHSFTARSIAGMAEGMHASLQETLPAFDEAIACGPVELNAQMTRMTFAMVARSMFSTRLTEAQVQQISQSITRIQGFVVRQIIQPYLRPWFAMSGELARHKAARDAGAAILLRHIRARRCGRREDDLLQILLDADLGEGGSRLTDAEVLSESMQVLVAGHETSSTALGWALYLLSQDPDYAEQSRRELHAATHGRPLGFADLERAPFTMNLIEEALRLYPPFWMIDRQAQTDDAVGEVRIPAGATVIAFVHGVHNDGTLWEAPQAFAPQRFAQLGKAAVSGLHHLPFGAGPRRCIGASYAMLQMAMVLQLLQRDYRFRLAATPRVRPRPMILQRARDGVWMHFERRRDREPAGMA